MSFELKLLLLYRLLLQPELSAMEHLLPAVFEVLHRNLLYAHPVIFFERAELNLETVIAA